MKEASESKHGEVTRTGGRTGAALVGRELELAKLEATLNQACDGIGRIVFLTGEPGAGKTRLSQEFGSHARSSGWQVLAGRAYDMLSMPPFVPFIEALRDYVLSCPAERLREELGENAAEVAALVREVRVRQSGLDAIPSLPPELERYRLFDGISEFLLRIARGTPPGLVLIIDDLHWADKTTIMLIQYLARKIPTAPLLLLCLYRSTEVDRAHPLSALLADLIRDRLADHLELPLLSAEETIMLVERLASLNTTRSFTDRIYRETDGNPFFIEEIVYHLDNEGRNLSDSDQAKGAWSVPHSVRHVIEQRLSRLSPEANQVLEAAAVLGDNVAANLLASCVSFDAGVINQSLEQAVRRGMIREIRNGYQFAHSLIRRTIYDEIPHHLRQQLHLKAARAIELIHGRHLSPYMAILASHYQMAGPEADPEKVIDWTVRAAEAAGSVTAFEEAARLYQEAVHLVEENQLVEAEPSRYCRLLLALGEIQALSGDPLASHNSYKRAAEIAEQGGSPEHLARAALGFSGVQWGVVVAPGSAGLLEKALTRLGNDCSDLRIDVMCRLAEVLWTMRQDERGRYLSQEALALAQSSGSWLALARAAVALGWICPWPGVSGDILSWFRELPDTGQEQLNWRLKSMLQVHRFWSFLSVADIEGARAVLDEMEEAFLKARIPGLGWEVFSCRAVIAMMKGDFDRAESLYLQARNAARRINLETDQTYYLPLAAAARVSENRQEEIEQYLLDSCQHFSDFPILRAALAALYLRLNQREALLREYELLAARDFQDIREGGVDELYVLAVLAESCAVLGKARQASILYKRMENLAKFNLASGPACAFGSGARYLGLLATAMRNWERAIEHFEAALTMNRKMGARPWVVLTLRDYARALLFRNAAGDRSKADILLAEAQSEAAALGMRMLEDEVSALRAKYGKKKIRLTCPDGLTEREVEVLCQLSSGKSNGEIAGLLGLSLHTVERHIANIYAKINIHNRTQAARYVREKNLLSSPDPRST